MGDIAVDHAFQGLQAGNKYVGVADRVSSVRDPVPAEPTTREVVLPFVWALVSPVVRGARPQGVIGGGILAHQFLGVP
jgi:hypothetical protein